MRLKLGMLLAAFAVFSNSTFSLANVFYCTGTQFIGVKDHEVVEYKLENFKFSATEEKIQFGEEGYFFGVSRKPTMWVTHRTWLIESSTSFVSYDWGDFLAVIHRQLEKEGLVMTAKCEKFE